MVILLHIFDPQMVTIIDGKSLAQKLRRKIKEEVSKYLDSGNRAPHLAAILVGEDGASKTYVASKERDCDFVGFDSTVHRLPVDTSENELLDLIDSIDMSAFDDELVQAFEDYKQFFVNVRTTYAGVAGYKIPFPDMPMYDE